jgi:hypothetical protein
MVEQFFFSTASPFRQLFWRLPYEWQIKLILLVWEMLYRWRRRSWRWAGNYLSHNLSSYCPGQAGLVSVVLPVYNQADTLAAAIESVLQQSYSCLELIVVNDGSTDHTPQVLSQYAQHPNVTVINQPNQRLAGALNQGFQAARGEFFTWTSGDNLMHPQQVQHLVSYLQANPQVAVVYADYELMDDAEHPIKDAAAVFMRGERGSSVVRPKHETARLNVGFECVVGPCFMYRRLVYPLIGSYNSALDGSEDFDFWIRINNFFKICHLGERQPLYFYRLHQQSMSARMKPRISQQRRWLMQREQRFQQQLNLPLQVAVDELTAQLLDRVQVAQPSLPALSCQPYFPQLTHSDFSGTAVLVHVSSLNAEIVEHCRQMKWLLLSWLMPDNTLTSTSSIIAQADLIISGGHTLPGLNNVVIAAQPEDIYYLARVFMASRLETSI